jgi:hypothetical protein
VPGLTVTLKVNAFPDGCPELVAPHPCVCPRFLQGPFLATLEVIEMGGA